MNRIALISLAALALIVIATLAMRCHPWPTGESSALPLPLVAGGPAAAIAHRLWIDTDAACGEGRTTDPDDCFAILLLARSPEIEIVGISTVFGNAPLDVTDRVTRTLATMLERESLGKIPVVRGSPEPIGDQATIAPAPAHAAIRDALARDPLTVVSLGPLTNIAAALGPRPDLRENVTRLVAVMGRRRGHLFHPSEGQGGGMLLGHGPIFRDFNFDKDRAAAVSILNMHVAMSLIPYTAGREVTISGEDLSRLEAAGGAAHWVAERAHEWHAFWKEEVGRDGFYPFDLLDGAYVVERRLFDCAPVRAWIGPDPRSWAILRRSPALLVGLEDEMSKDVQASGTVVYCPQTNAGLHEFLISRLAGSSTTFAKSSIPICHGGGMPSCARMRRM